MNKRLFAFALSLLTLFCSTMLMAQNHKVSRSGITIKGSVTAEQFSQLLEQFSQTSRNKYPSITLEEATKADLEVVTKGAPDILTLVVRKSPAVGSYACLSNLKSLGGLTISNSGDAKDLSVLANIAKLTIFTITQTTIHSEDLSFVPESLSSISLDMIGTNLKSLKGIEKCDRISRFKITRTQHNIDLSALALLPNFYNLELTYVKNMSLAPVVNMKRLNRVNLYGSEGLDLTPLANSTIKELSIYAVKKIDWNSVGKITSLNKLETGLNGFQSIDWIANLSNLKSLSLFSDAPADYKAIAALKNLTDLKLWQMKKPVNVQDFAACTSPISTLNLSSTDILNANALSEMPCLGTTLKTLNLEASRYSLKNHAVVDLSFLAKCTKLRSLNLANRKSTGIENVANCQELTSLDIRGDYTDVSMIGKLPKLASITVSLDMKDKANEAAKATGRPISVRASK